MRTSAKFFLVVIFLIVYSSPNVFSFNGPFQVKNQYPLFLHANQPYLESALMESSFSTVISHSSTYTVQSSDDWDINLDMEITEIVFRDKRIIKDFIEVGIDIPIIIFNDGFMDGFLEDYHSTFGFSDYGRSERPLNNFLYEIRRNNDLIVKGETGAGLGDIRLTLKKNLISSVLMTRSSGFNLSLMGSLEFPTGNAKKGYGNGGTDAGVAVLLDKPFSESIMTYWNFGAVFPADVRGHHKVSLKDFVYGGVAIETKLGHGFSFVSQFQAQSAVYPDTELSAVDRPAYMLAFGSRYVEGRGSLEFSLTEDVSVSGAPDFILNLTYKMQL